MTDIKIRCCKLAMFSDVEERRKAEEKLLSVQVSKNKIKIILCFRIVKSVAKLTPTNTRTNSMRLFNRLGLFIKRM